MRVALVHDYLTQRGGAERVVLSMLKAFPRAPLYTSLYEAGGTFPEFASADIRPLPVNRIGPLRRHHRWALPLLAPVFSRCRVEADVVLCSSSGWAHGVPVDGRKVVYCYAPARWLYQTRRYVGDGRPLLSVALGAAKPWLTRWDQRAARSADCYLTSSRAVAAHIGQVYGIHAALLPPPHNVAPDAEQAPVPGIEPGFLLCVSRLLAYKNVDAVVAAVSGTADRLVVVGQGPERGRLEARCPANVRFLGGVSDAELRWLYAQCAGLVAASYEDYGLTPLEAAAFGKPSCVLRLGGFLDTVVAGQTGIFFDEPTGPQIRAGLEELRSARFSPALLRQHADGFSEDRFVEALRRHVLPDRVPGQAAYG
ncbi:MAG TPA: glycosyltransferase [Actinomycetota bacterium]|nr:glycosyltransferase [Actinomycetota bacterium]